MHAARLLAPAPRVTANVRTMLRGGWPAYSCEAAGLGGFLFTVADVTARAPQPPVSAVITSDPAKRAGLESRPAHTL